jgi:putative phosphoribosyl transferase
MLFQDRCDAGAKLALKLGKYQNRNDVVVLGLARGGLVVADEVASKLKAPLDVIVVRKIGAPGNPELALGAIAEQGEGVFNDALIHLLGVSPKELREEVQNQKKLLKERLNLYRKNSPALSLMGKTVILIDDGIATGASMLVAIQSVRSAGAKKIVLAVPVAAPDSLRKIDPHVDETICLFSPPDFEAVGSFYHRFEQTSDEEVIQLLYRS